jgi:hypothetical protein
MTGVIGSYRLRELLGTGATAVVRRADPLTGGGPCVAVKRRRRDAPPSATVRLQREADVLRSLHHPHIVRLIDVVDDEDAIALVLELADGGTLAERAPMLTVGQIVDVTLDLLAALAAVHDAGYMHLDVTPSAVLFDTEGRVLLADFGLARRIGEDDGSGMSAGTPGFIDPAVLDGSEPDHRADLYAVGAVLRSMLHDRRPTGTEEVIRNAMAPAPGDRYQSAAEMAAALKAVCIMESPAAEPGPRGRPNFITREFGTRPPVVQRPLVRPDPSHRRTAARLRLVAASATVGVGVLTAALLHAGAAHRHATIPPVGPVCPPTSAVAASDRSPATVVLSDLAGDGCRVPVVVAGGMLTVPGSAGDAPATYAVGDPGDQVVIGSWDCSGRETPALYRPSTGEVFEYGAWPGVGESLESVSRMATAVIDGTATVVPSGRGCAAVSVHGGHKPAL